MTGAVYIVTDIEADGPSWLENSMLSFASVAVDGTGTTLGEFEAVLAPRADRSPNPQTARWWQDQPEAWAATTRDPRPAAAVMAEYVAWLESFDMPRVFAARPLAFDGGWLNEYLVTFAGRPLVSMPHTPRPLFAGAGLDIPSLMAGLYARPGLIDTPGTVPDDWLGGIEHTHRAIDDARGFAVLLGRLFATMDARPAAQRLEYPGGAA